MPREEHTEYRVLVRQDGKLFSPCIEPLHDAQARVAGLAHSSLFEEVRIEQRTVQIGPWEPIDPQEHPNA